MTEALAIPSELQDEMTPAVRAFVAVLLGQLEQTKSNPPKESTHASEVGCFTLQEVADIRGVNISTVRKWIKKGELEAVNQSANPLSRRPRYRVSQEALGDFLKSRSTGVRRTGIRHLNEPKPDRQRRRKKPVFKQLTR